MKYLFAFLVLSMCAPSVFSQESSLTVVIIRHGEKNDETGNLSCKGLHRAMALPPVLNGKFKHFSYIYVPTITTGKVSGHGRMFQTATPLAVQDNLPMNTKYSASATAEVAQDVLKRSGVVLIVWEHENIPDIAAALGVKDKGLKWKDGDFDGIYVITFTTSKKGNLKASLAVDKEGLNPPDACNF